MRISENIANLIDNHYGLFTFGSKYEEQELLNILLGDVFSKLKSKELISIDNPESYKDIKNWKFSNKVLVVDLKIMPQPKDFSERRFFSEKLHQFCTQNNNTAILLANMTLDLSLGIEYYKITPIEVVYASNAVWTLSKNILRNPKNRYEIDGESYNLIAYLREILND